jgi:hypothetical protein
MTGNTAVAPTRTSLSTHFPIVELDLRGILPTGWREQVLDCARTFREMSTLSGASVTSRQRQLGYSGACPVGVVSGAVVARELPWLLDLYRRDVLALANDLGEDRRLGTFVDSDDLRSAVNLNVLPDGSQYEWHVDSNPMTGLLFVTDQPEGTGGELKFVADPVFRAGEEWERVVVPRSGRLLLFDAREAAHTVLPVRGGYDRVSVPMNYYRADAGRTRPSDLDQYLYGH